MFQAALKSWIVFALHVCWLGITIGSTYSDLNRCVEKGGRASVRYKNQFCWLTKHDVNIACPGNKKIILVSVQFTLKDSTKECTKRVLNSEDSFCCNVLDDDVVFDGQCLKDVWNTEDRDHYRNFIQVALKQCSNKKKCILRADIFSSLQRELPRTRKFSSYFQINHQCVSEPTVKVDICSDESISGTNIHIQGSIMSTGQANKNCTCHVSSDGNGKVTVKAVDVRTANTGLILRSDNGVKDLSNSQQPLFGFKELLTDDKMDIITSRSYDTADNLWLQLTGLNGQNVCVVCKGPQHTTSARPTEATTHPMTTSPLPDRETPVVQDVVADEQDDFLEEYWPMIYLGAGSGITIVLAVCVLGSILICRYSMMKEKRKGQYGNPYRHSQVNYNRSGQYDTVLDDMQHIPGHMVASNQETLEWR